MSWGSLEPGTLIGGDFVVESTLRVGGVGAIYRVVQRSTGQRSTVRVLSPRVGDVATREQLVVLARGAPVIASAHVPAVLATGFDLDPGVAWLAMEDVAGEALPTLLAKTGPLPLAVVSLLMRQVFDAVASAHEVGVVHGELRADDVYVASTPREKPAWRVSVLGFGVARGRAESRWQRGARPEGSAASLSLDVRALGTLAFAMLSGGREAESDPAARGEGRADRATLPPTARLRGLGVTNVALLGWFDEWFDGCVAVDPEARFDSVVEAEAAWEHAVAVRAPADRRRWALGALGLGMLGLGVMIAARPQPTASAGATPGEVHRRAVTPVCPPGMVWLAGGQFLMGSREDRGEADQRPRHVVNVTGFCLDRTEVTVGAYGSYWAQRGHPLELAPDEGLHCNWRHADRVDHPINCIDWSAARGYCEWPGHPGGPRHLPTEAQWAFAAQGPGGGRYPWGNTVPGEGVCWSGLSPRLGTCPVGESRGDVTSTGLLDMAGNVAEWTADLYAPGYVVPARSVPIDPTGPAWTPEGLRVFRGGTWAISVASAVRAATRGRHTESMRSRGVGFRCAGRAPTTGDGP